MQIFPFGFRLLLFMTTTEEKGSPSTAAAAARARARSFQTAITTKAHSSTQCATQQKKKSRKEYFTWKKPSRRNCRHNTKDCGNLRFFYFCLLFLWEPRRLPAEAVAAIVLVLDDTRNQCAAVFLLLPSFFFPLSLSLCVCQQHSNGKLLLTVAHTSEASFFFFSLLSIFALNEDIRLQVATTTTTSMVPSPPLPLQILSRLLQLQKVFTRCRRSLNNGD